MFDKEKKMLCSINLKASSLGFEQLTIEIEHHVLT